MIPAPRYELKLREPIPPSKMLLCVARYAVDGFAGDISRLEQIEDAAMELLEKPVQPGDIVDFKLMRPDHIKKVNQELLSAPNDFPSRTTLKGLKLVRIGTLPSGRFPILATSS